MSYLDRLDNIYTADRKTLLNNLKTLPGGDQRQRPSVCQSIIDNQANNAFEYYGANGPGNDFFAQQNTLALQYTALTRSTAAPRCSAGRYLHRRAAVIFSGGIPVPIAGEAAFVSFVDRPMPTPGGLLVTSDVDILALEPDEPLSTNNVSTKVRANPAAPPHSHSGCFELFGAQFAPNSTPGPTFILGVVHTDLCQPVRDQLYCSSYAVGLIRLSIARSWICSPTEPGWAWGSDRGRRLPPPFSSSKRRTDLCPGVEENQTARSTPGVPAAAPHARRTPCQSGSDTPCLLWSAPAWENRVRTDSVG